MYTYKNKFKIIIKIRYNNVVLVQFNSICIFALWEYSCIEWHLSLRKYYFYDGHDDFSIINNNVIKWHNNETKNEIINNGIFVMNLIKTYTIYTGK